MASKEYLNKNLYALVLAGGVGSRFWPFSRELEPKQFLKIIKDKSLLQDTISRLKGLVSPDKIYIITNKIYFYEVKRHTEGLDIPEGNIILEPEGKNTAPAIGLCARIIEQQDKNGILIVLPADHYIPEVNKFQKCLRQAVVCSREDYLVTIGIKPNKAATGYGYIKISAKRKAQSAKQKPGYSRVEAFLEKPTLRDAQKYIRNRNYFWNSGIFVWKARVFLEEMRKYIPVLYSQLRRINSVEDIRGIWPKIKSVSVDYGIMEYSKNIVLIPAEFAWSDLGSWDALEELLPKNKQGNVIQADSLDLDSQGLCVFGRGNRLIATIGLKDLILADTPDALLVCNRHKTQDVKKVVERLKSDKRKEYIAHMTDKRPWGSYTVLQEGEGFKIKLVEIDPQKRLSLQRHTQRAEHWVVVSGSAKVTCGETVRFIQSNQSIYIPQGTKHRLENPTNAPLKIVEVQTGSYLEEDDIERFEDDFQR